MRIVFLNTDYDAFLEELYSRSPGLSARSYEEQMAARNASLFGVADFYSRNLRELGHEAVDIHANNQFLQAAWLRERGQSVDPGKTAPPSGWYAAAQRMRRRAGRTCLLALKPVLNPLLRRLDSRHDWLYETAVRQIREFRPDVIVNQSVDGIPGPAVAAMKPHCRLLVGQIAAPIPHGTDLAVYDLMVSSLPNYVSDFASLGLRAVFSALAFEPRVLDVLSPLPERDVALSFVGSLSPHHKQRVELLRYLAARFDLRTWGNGGDLLAGTGGGSAHPPVWGRDMYGVLARSAITINHHIGIAGPFCNNMRMFEATGMGAAMVVDRKSNLRDYFEEDSEVLAYDSPEECAEKVHYLLEHPSECRSLGERGRARTLACHTYPRRVEEFAGLVAECLP